MPIRKPTDTPRAVPDPALEPRRIIETLGRLITPARRKRIARVIEQRVASVTVVLENPYDPHNGAAVLRTCEALGLHHVHVVSASGPFRFSPKVTQNAHKWLEVFLHTDILECLMFLKRVGYVTWAAATPELDSCGRNAADSSRLDSSRPMALVFGNEHAGLSAEALEACDRRFHLPMYGFSESLNLSVSAALAVREAVRHRRAVMGRAGDLPPWARDQLTAAYYLRSVKHAVDVLTEAVLRRTIAPRG